MSAIEQLKAAARDRRDALIRQARIEYGNTVRELTAISRRVNQKLTCKARLRLDPGGDYSKMNARQAAELVPRDSGPMTLPELTLEVMRRGCRSDDSPHSVAHAIRCSLNYHKGRFSRDGEGRWAVRQGL